MTGLIEGQWYAYRIRAFNKLGASRPCRATDEIQAVDAKGKRVLTHPDLMLLDGRSIVLFLHICTKRTFGFFILIH